VRRDPKANNFKAILEAIRSALNTAAAGDASVGGGVAVAGGDGSPSGAMPPPWLSDILLGYGDPAAGHFSALPPEQQCDTADWGDTFTSPALLRAAFPTAAKIVFCEEGQGGKVLAEEHALPPYRLRFVRSGRATGVPPSFAAGACFADTTIFASPYSDAERAIVPELASNYRGPNSVPFTAVQTEAIFSALNPGLSLVVGPPGTGKTDVAVQSITLLLRNFPSARILLVTHSNAALNDLFEKLLARGCPPRHLLRLGMGERDLEVEGDYS